MKRDTIRVLVGSLVAAVFLGCGSGPDKDESPRDTDSESKTAELKEYKTSELKAELADYVPKALDGKRVEIAGPKGWSRSSFGEASPPQIIFFKKNKSLSVPIIVVVGEDDTTDIGTVTKENLNDFVSRIGQELKDEDQELAKGEKLRPMILGGRPCARYVLGGQWKGISVHRQILVTVVNRRRYTVELRVHEGSIMTDRDQAYAVLSGMRFLEETSGDNTDPTATDSTEKTNG